MTNEHRTSNAPDQSAGRKASEQDAIQMVRRHIQAKYPDYPADRLVAERFAFGWTVFPASEPSDLGSQRIGQLIFLIGDDGQIMESSSSLPPGKAEDEFTRLHGSGKPAGSELDVESLIRRAMVLLGSANPQSVRWRVLDSDDAVYVWEDTRGGGAIIMSADGSVLFADSSVSPDQHEAEFRSGRRTPLERFAR